MFHKSPVPIFLSLLAACLCLSGPFANPSSAQTSTPAYDYIAWDAHRFSRTPAEYEIDARYFSDLGFTHSLIGGGFGNTPRTRGMAKNLSNLSKAFGRYGLRVGFKYGWTFDGLQEEFDWDDMRARGMTLRVKPKGDLRDYNPVHPEVVQYMAEGLLASLDIYRQHDPTGAIGLFLLGSEFTWGFPKRDSIPPAAVETILTAAREDGVLGPDEDDWDALRWWWSSSHGKGRDWRIRKKWEDGVLERIPDAQFMIDPIWAVKIVHGFGGDWSYLGRNPKGMADSVIRVKAQCWPSPATHSVQLIRGAYHDSVLEGNLLSLCMGIDKLYHWGLHQWEPNVNPWYRYHGKRSPLQFPRFTLETERRHAPDFEDWDALAAALYEKRSDPAGQVVWDRLDPTVHRETAAAATLGMLQVSDAMKQRIVASLNRMVESQDFYKAEAFADIKWTDRMQALSERIEADEADAEDVAELNRLLIAQIYPGALPEIPANIRARLDHIERKRLMKEPAIRSTGRFVALRGEMLRSWEPMEPRIAVLGGIFSPGDTYLSMITGNIPFELMRNKEHRRRKLPEAKWALVLGKTEQGQDYQDLLALDRKGGTVFVPKGFAQPADQPPLKNAVTLPDGALGKQFSKGRGKGFSGKGDMEVYLDQTAELMREAVQNAGFKTYFDTENLDVVMRAYRYKGHPMLFVVNDKREPFNVGQPNAVEFLVRDATEGLRVIDVDTGQDMALTPSDEGWIFKDTVPPAWYKLYAVVKAGQAYQGPAPLPAGPAVSRLVAETSSDGVVLSWEVNVEDWVGCDVQWYRIHRGRAGEKPELLKEIYGRPVRGPGGLVTQWADRSAEPGQAYTYRIRTVTPLRAEGPLSTAATVSP